MIGFPDSSDSQANGKILDLKRLMDRSLTDTRYIDGRRASRLLGVILGAYRDSVRSREFGDSVLSQRYESNELFGLMLAAAFDLVANAEYLHGRVVNSKWIYCHRHDETACAY